MTIDKSSTPEEQWSKISKCIFKNEVPYIVEELIKKGFAESESESEKWDKLLVFMTEIKKRFT